VGRINRRVDVLGLLPCDGWFDLLCRLCRDLEPLVAEFERTTGCQFEVLQVEEKFGGLRFNVNDANEAVRQRIQTAQGESFQTCEVCGQSGKVRGGGWIKTLCDEHAASANGARENG
jgi:hypothetical protein